MCMKWVLGRIGFSFAAGLVRVVYAVEAPAAAFVVFRYRTSSPKFSVGDVVGVDEFKIC
jgi:hypothetical protein